MQAEVSSLRKANEILSKRRRAKKTRVRLGGSLTAQEGLNILDQKAADEQIQQEVRRNGGRTRAGRTTVQCCGICGRPGHNSRTCREVGDLSDSSISSVIVVDS